MGWYSKIVWSEGLFLRPQMLQQQERYLEYYAHQRALAITPFFWGLGHYNIDNESLNLGKVVLHQVSGIFMDGTPFGSSGSTELPAPLQISHEHLEQTIYLAIPARVPNTHETGFPEDIERSMARYKAYIDDLMDSNTIGMGAQPVQMSNLRLKLLPEKELSDGWIGIAIGRVTEIFSDGSIRLDPDFIPPVIGYGASRILKDWHNELHGLIALRTASLATRLVGADSRSSQVAEVTDYFILQILNRYQPVFKHHLTVLETSPRELYLLYVQLAGELATFAKPQVRRAEEFPVYDHKQPRTSIEPIVIELRSMISTILERSAQKLELKRNTQGIYQAVMSPADLSGFGTMVIALHADMPKDTLGHQFVAQAKVASSEHILDLVRSHLPGVPITLLPVAPRQIPFNMGYVYIEIEQQGMLWERIKATGNLNLHVSGQFPNLNIELWGIKDK